MAGQPIDIHYAKMEEWLNDRKSVLGKKHSGEIAFCLQAAPLLVQATRYDVPALKKAISRLSNQRSEATQMLHDAPKNVNALREKRRGVLARYHIMEDPADDSCTQSLDALLERRISAAEATVTEHVAHEAPGLLARCFAAYTKHLRTLKCDASSFSPGAQFPWLERLVEDCPQLICSLEARGEPLSSEVGAVDGGGEIDWGDDEEIAPSAAASADGAIQISWDEEPGEDSNAVGQQNVWSGALLPPERSSGVCVAITRAEHRACILQELSSLAGFLSERIADELDDKDLRHTPENRFAYCGELAELESGVERLRSALVDGVDAELLRMRQNFRAKEKFIAAYEAACRSIAAAAARVHAAEGTIQLVDSQLEVLQPQLQALILSTREKQRDCEAALSKVFPDREVTIVGDINSM